MNIILYIIMGLIGLPIILFLIVKLILLGFDFVDALNKSTGEKNDDSLK